MEIRRSRPSIARAVVVAALLVLAGCGGDDGDGASDATSPVTETPATDAPAGDVAEGEGALDSEVPDLCTLFTAEDFEAVTGEPAGAPAADEPVGAIRGACTVSAEAGFPLAMVAAYDESARESTIELAEAEPIDDLGQPAHWDDTTGLLVPIDGKDWYLQVLVTGGGADREASVAAAQIVLDRLGG